MDSNLRGNSTRITRTRFLWWLPACASIVSCAVMQPVPSRGGESYIVVDLHSKKILVEKDSTDKRQVASLTKIATAMVVLDWMDLAGVEAGTWIRVPESVAGMGGANPLGMYVGDEITIRDALYSAIIGSDNVSAQTLANFVGYELARQMRQGGNPVDLFVAQMNALAKKNGCVNTKFTNPHGLDHERPVPYSTAADIARIAMYAMSKASFTFYCSQKERKISFRRAGQLQQFLVKNTNQILGRNNIDGVKTGMTSKAGQCLVTSATRPNTVIDLADGQKQVVPHRLIVVVLGSPSRFDQSIQLLEAGWRQYDGWSASGRPVRSPEELLLTLP